MAWNRTAMGPIRSCRCWRTMGTGSAVPRGVASAWWVSFPRRPDCPFPNLTGSCACVTAPAGRCVCRNTGIRVPTAARSNRLADAVFDGVEAGQPDEEPVQARQRDEEGMLPLGSASPLDMITRDFNERPLIPWHQTSTGRAGVLTTFVAGSGAQLIPGPPIGIDALSRELFQFDCWGTYDARMAASPDLFFSGLRGQGKSYCAKTIAVREIGFGRNIIVQSDRQGEWKPSRGPFPAAGRLPRQRQLSEPVRHARHVPPHIRGGQARVAPGGPGRQEKRHDGVGGGGEGTGPSIPVGQGHAVPDRPAHRLVRYRSDDVAGRGQTTVRLGLGGFHILAYPRLRALP